LDLDNDFIFKRPLYSNF